MSPARSRFTAQRHLATGGMAEVHLAVLRGPHGFEKQAILKQIRPEFARDPEFRRMFIDEARLMASLSHANVVGVLDFGESDAEGLYLALEYVEGLDLEAALTAGGPLETDLALCIVRSVLHALAYVHGLRSKSGAPLRIVHRDVSPSNVLLGINGDVKLGDFGIARMAQRASKTEPGTFKGKAAYASPEQVLGLELDGRSDLFAVGIMLFELLTGERPFVAANRALLMRDVIEGPPVDVGGRAAHLSRPLVAVLERVLDRDPERRFQTAEEMAQALDACRAGPPLGPGDVARLVSRLAPKPPVADPFAAALAPPEEDPASTFEEDAASPGLASTVDDLAPVPLRSNPGARPAPPTSPRASSRWVGAMLGGLLGVLVVGGAAVWFTKAGHGVVAQNGVAQNGTQRATQNGTQNGAQNGPHNGAQNGAQNGVAQAGDARRDEALSGDAGSEVLLVAAVIDVPAAGVAPTKQPSRPASLSVSTLQRSLIKVDGQGRGPAPLLNLKVAPGVHEVKVVNFQLGKMWTGRVVVKAGEHHVVTVDLVREGRAVTR